MPQFISDERGPFGRNVNETSAVRQAIRAEGLDTPVVCTGGVHNFELAEKMLRDGACDIVGAARQSLADPDWLLKISLGLAPPYEPASSRITAKVSTRSIRSSPVSSGTRKRWTTRRFGVRRTANVG